jgi:hypothetical protein
MLESHETQSRRDLLIFWGFEQRHGKDRDTHTKRERERERERERDMRTERVREGGRERKSQFGTI